MARKVRIVHMPLQSLQGLRLKTLLISHWALLIGENDLLLEIFPKEGSTFWTPLNSIQVTRQVSLEERNATLKFGIFRQADTEKSDDDIIALAKEVIDRNPIYCLVGYNCQSFVNDLAEKIAIPSFWNDMKSHIRKFIGKTWIYRGESVVDAPDADEEIARTQLDYLVKEGERLQSTVNSFQIIAKANSGEKIVLQPLLPQEQKYLGIEEDDDLVSSGIGMVYGAVEAPAYVFSGINEPENPRNLTPEQLETLKAAEAFVGHD